MIRTVNVQAVSRVVLAVALMPPRRAQQTQAGSPSAFPFATAAVTAPPGAVHR